MSHALAIHNSTTPPLFCNQTLIDMDKDKGWHQKMEGIQSALQTLKHFQGEVWYNQGCKEQCGEFWNYDTSYNTFYDTSCKKLVISSKLREALQVYGRFYLFKNEEEDSQEEVLYYPLSPVECLKERISFSFVISFAQDNLREAESKKRANLEGWIQRAITVMEPAIKNYEKDLDTLKSINASCLSSPPARRTRSYLRHSKTSKAVLHSSSWKVWGVLFLAGGPVAFLVIGGCCLATRWLNKRADANDSVELQPLQ